MFIGALLSGDPRHSEARPIVDSARSGTLSAVMSVAVLCEVYAALTWEKAVPRHEPDEAANAVRLLVAAPSAIRVLGSGINVAMKSLELAAKYQSRSRRTHDAHHAATALCSGIQLVYSHDLDDWKNFEVDRLSIAGPPSVLARLKP